MKKVIFLQKLLMTKQTFTCSQSTIKAAEKVVKYVQSEQ